MDNTEKRAERVTTNQPIVRKKSAGRKLFDSFFADDIRSVKEYVVEDVLKPYIRDTLFDCFTKGFEGLVYGTKSGASRSGRSRQTSGGTIATYTSYNNYSNSSNRQRAPERERGSNISVDEIIISDRGEAELVLDNMLDTLDRYHEVRLADYYEFCGCSSNNYTDNNRGWRDLGNAYVRSIRGGYIIDGLPRPIDLRH